MAEWLATRASRGHRTLCLPIAEESYRRIVAAPGEFRRVIDECFRRSPELFPANFGHGYQRKDDRMSAKQGLPIRRIVTRDRTADSIRPSFLMPSLTARAQDVEGPLFWRRFGVPFWALAPVFGGDSMSWYRQECALGRFRVAGTTAPKAELPKPLLADEHHQSLDGAKVDIATTVGSGCCLGAEPATTAGTDDRKTASGVFQDEARDVAPRYAPRTVSTDGWKGTQAAWKALFPQVIVLLGFLHAWLKIRDRANPRKEVFVDVSGRVWGAYHAPERRCFAPRLRRLRQWASGPLRGVVLEAVRDLCRQRAKFSVASRYPGGHRTSTMLARPMRGRNRYFDRGQHLHGSREACRLPCRAWALLAHFTPWHPATARKNDGWRCRAERLNGHRYHDCWLQNLLISASLGGYRSPRPQNP